MTASRLAFMGTPDFAVHSLSALLDAGHQVAAVYTQPPSPRGRGQTLQPSPVHAFAESRGLSVHTPKSMKAPDAVAAFQALELDVAVVVAYGQILLPAVLDAPRLGSFNLHGSLLPRWRGAAPIQRAILGGDRETGVQVMRMSAGLDEGPVLFTARTPIAADDTAQSLHDRLAQLGADLWPAALDAIAAGTAVETPQADTGATYARKITPSEARIDWSRPAVEIDRQIRGLSPFPGAWFTLETPRGPVRIKALDSRMALGDGVPGEVLDDQLRVACGSGAVRLLRLQREGRAASDAEAFLRGLPVATSERLG
jgi:methionyl-tRNA formyltransferase